LQHKLIVTDSLQGRLSHTQTINAAVKHLLDRI
jgi:hypothetical protein